MNGLLEILTNKFWYFSPDHLHAIRKVMEQNLNGHLPYSPSSRRVSYMASRTGEPMESLVTEGGESADNHKVSRLSQPFVNVIMVDGPVTRNGGACSYGSIDHRDMIMMAADNTNCRGHVFFINTPGGSVAAIKDYMQAVEYARSKGQPVYAFIDGLCASAGMHIAAMCDKRFYMHPKDEVGCIGAMAAFYTEKDGEKNQYTNETFHEIYDPESFDKNKEYRDVANDGNSEAMVEELKTLGADFRAYVKEHCPNAEEEHLHGKMFSAGEVKGILVDEQSTLGEVIAMCFDTYEENHQSQNTDYEMEEKYLILAEACGAPELVINEEGTFLNIALIDKLTEKLNSDREQLAAAETLRDNLQQTHDSALAEMQSTHEKAMKEAAENLAQVESELSSVKESLKNAEQMIADRDEQIASLTAAPAESPDEAPANNGTGTEVETDNSMPAYDDNLSPLENERIRNEWKAKNGL